MKKKSGGVRYVKKSEMAFTATSGRHFVLLGLYLILSPGGTKIHFASVSWLQNCLEVGKSNYYIHGRSKQMWYKREICHVRKSKTVLDSGFQAMDFGFQVLDTVFVSGTWILFKFQALVGFCIPWAVFRIPKHRIPDFPDSGIRIPLHEARERKSWN